MTSVLPLAVRVRPRQSRQPSQSKKALGFRHLCKTPETTAEVPKIEAIVAATEPVIPSVLKSRKPHVDPWCAGSMCLNWKTKAWRRMNVWAKAPKNSGWGRP
jgi:hypothetical protein